MSDQKPSFYAVIPSTVRYDERLSSSEKLFYAEITAINDQIIRYKNKDSTKGIMIVFV